VKPNGIVSCAIDMKDHFSYFDRTLSPYNFLKFSDARWRFVNPSLHFQNRLRRSDYLALVAAAGFEVLDETAVWGDDADMEALSSLPPHAQFLDRYRLDDLAVRETTVTARLNA
jgi:hypothetical protein